MRDSYDVAAVGGGPDALVAAAYLAGAGHSVLVVGEQGQPGGVAANVQIAPGFQFPVFPETLPSRTGSSSAPRCSTASTTRCASPARRSSAP